MSWASQGYQTMNFSLEWRMLHQVVHLPFVGGFSSAEELKDIIMCIPWGGTRTLPQGCTIVSWLLLPCHCIPSLPWLATVWMCPLELRDGHGGWKLFPTNKKQRTQKGFHAQERHRVLLGFTMVSLSFNHFSEWVSQNLVCIKITPCPWKQGVSQDLTAHLVQQLHVAQESTF